MKILVVHQYYLRPGDSGGSRFNEMARLWAEAGHEVEVVAGTINYQTGKTHRGFERVWAAREADGRVDVWWCHVPPSYSGSYLGKFWAFAGFALSAATAIFRAKRPDVVVATSPPLFVAFPGWLASRIRWRRVPWVFEVRDLWPESVITMGFLREGSVLAKGLYGIERAAYRACDRINVLTPAFRENIVGRGLANESKVTFIPNGADLSSFWPAPRDNQVRREFGWGDRCVLLYAGAHGPANAVGQLLDAARELRNRPDILICTVGDGPERTTLQEHAYKAGLDNVMFCGAQPKDRMPDFVNAADIGCAVLRNNPTFRTVYPNKVFDYMACERPTLIAIDGVARQLVCEEAKAGVFAEPENGPALAGAIRTLADDADWRVELGTNGRRWVVENASREALAGRYLRVMEELVKLDRPDAPVAARREFGESSNGVREPGR